MDEARITRLVPIAVQGDKAALEEVVGAIQDDVYRLAFRMLGNATDAEDSAQEILLKVCTHLAQWRGESSFRTWVWRIATRHVLGRKRSRDEEECSFQAIEGLIEAGAEERALPAMDEAELLRLETELRLACTEAMLLSIDREHRIAWIVADMLGWQSEDAAAALEISPEAFRKRVSRARDRLATWTLSHCGLVSPANACRCRRQVPIALEVGAIRRDVLAFADHPRTAEAPPLPPPDAEGFERAAAVMCAHPSYKAPDRFLQTLRDVLDAERRQPSA